MPNGAACKALLRPEASGVRLRIQGCVRNDLADLDTGRAGCRAGDFRRVTTRRELGWIV